MHCLSQLRTRHLLRPAPAQWTGSSISSLGGVFIWAELTVVSRQAFRKASPLSFSHSLWFDMSKSSCFWKREERGSSSSSCGSAFSLGTRGPGFPISVCAPSTCYQPFHEGFLAAELKPSLEKQRRGGNELQPWEELCMGSIILVLLTFSSSSTPGWPLNTAISIPFRERECYSSQIHSEMSSLWMASSSSSV